MSRVIVATIKQKETPHSPSPSASSSTPPLQEVYGALAAYFRDAAAAKKRHDAFAVQEWELGVVARYVFREVYAATVARRAADGVASPPAPAMRLSCASVPAFLASSPVSSLSALRGALQEEQRKAVHRRAALDPSSGATAGKAGTRPTPSTPASHPIGTPPPLAHCFAEVVALCQVLETHVTRVALEEDTNRIQKEENENEKKTSVWTPVHTSPHAIRLVGFLAMAMTLWPAVYLSDMVQVVVDIWKADAMARRQDERVRRGTTHEGGAGKEKVEEEEEANRVEAEVAWRCIASVLWCWSVMDPVRAGRLRSLSGAMMEALHSWSIVPPPHASSEETTRSSPLSWHSLWDLLQDEVVGKVCPPSSPSTGEGEDTYGSVWRSEPNRFSAAETPSTSRCSPSPTGGPKAKSPSNEKDNGATFSSTLHRECAAVVGGGDGDLSSSSFSTVVKDLSVGRSRPSPSGRHPHSPRSLQEAGGEQVGRDAPPTTVAQRMGWSSSFSSPSDGAIDFDFWTALASTPPPPLDATDVVITRRRTHALLHEGA